jgi:hypothetical protein
LDIGKEGRLELKAGDWRMSDYKLTDKMRDIFP